MSAQVRNMLCFDDDVFGALVGAWEMVLQRLKGCFGRTTKGKKTVHIELAIALRNFEKWTTQVGGMVVFEIILCCVLDLYCAGVILTSLCLTLACVVVSNAI